MGFPTIGYGHLIKKNETDLLQNIYSKKKLLEIFESDFNKAYKDYTKYYGKKKYNITIEGIYIEMIFQLGIKNQLKFKKMNNHIENNNFFMAALEMKNSLWYTQTPKRVDFLVNKLLKNKYEKKR